MFMNRRTVLKAGLASLMASRLGWSDTPAKDVYRGIKAGVHSYSLRKFSFAEALKIIRGFNVRYLTLNPIHLPLKSSPQEIADAKKAIADAGLTVMGIGVVQFSKKDGDPRKVFDLAKAMGMPTIIANPSEEDLDTLDNLVEEYGIRIAIHNHGPGSKYSVPEDQLKVFEKHHKSIGACVDLGHYERSGVKAEDALKALSARLYDVHFKDVSEQKKDAEFRLVGQGIINWPAVAKTLLDLKFAGQVGLEYEVEPESPQASMAKCFSALADILGKVPA